MQKDIRLTGLHKHQLEKYRKNTLLNVTVKSKSFCNILLSGKNFNSDLRLLIVTKTTPV